MSKAESMKMCLANLGKERINEVFDPEIAARDITKEEKLHRLSENINVAVRGGRTIKWARNLYEEETGKIAVSKENTLSYKYTDELKKIENK